MKEENGEKKGKQIPLQAQEMEPPVPEKPEIKLHELPLEELQEMIGKGRRFFRIAADLSIHPN